MVHKYNTLARCASHSQAGYLKKETREGTTQNRRERSVYQTRRSCCLLSIMPQPQTHTVPLSGCILSIMSQIHTHDSPWCLSLSCPPTRPSHTLLAHTRTKIRIDMNGWGKLPTESIISTVKPFARLTTGKLKSFPSMKEFLAVSCFAI